ncbi:MAG: pantoate--beta-alanine ligase [Gammaproteobacteria bacterium]|nr:pantoate--beta-alanine ligase [Gammaproteobacteria bacterium]
MQIVSTIDELRRVRRDWLRAGERVAFVPTMGNLHAGHLKLVREARARAPRVVVSIFVNPLQFGAGEDFAAYPHTPEQDEARLREAGVDLLFLPSEAEIYPHGREGGTFVEVPGLSDILCGASRPGHFRGVATVVAKLFNMVQPELALFGEKDYQQLSILRLMARDLNIPLELIGVPTEREADGLAMSSRNGYLTPEERAIAPALYQVLRDVDAELTGGGRDLATIETAAATRLQAAGLRPDYLTIRRAADLQLPQAGERRLVVLAAAYLGRARLIDNLLITLD